MLRKNLKISFVFCIILIFTTSCSAELGLNSIKKNGSISYELPILEVEYLCIGQADANLIILPNSEVMLIDAGSNKTADNLSDYIKSKGISCIDYLVATHPHEDHIGGLDTIINDFDIGEIYMPKLPSSQIPTTKTYEDVLKSIKNKNLKINRGKSDMCILESESDDLTINFLAPNSEEYEKINNYSIVTKIIFGKTSFLFMGDAEEESEKEILSQTKNLSADVLKCGHHGSKTSSTLDFLKQLCPLYAVIECGLNNSYGHPSKQTIKNLENLGTTIFRTDTQNTIKAESDGENIKMSTINVDLTD